MKPSDLSKKPRRHLLNVKLGLFGCVLSLSLAAILSLIVGSRSKLALESGKGRLMAALAAQIADHLNADIRDRSLEMNRLATLDIIRDVSAPMAEKRKFLIDRLKTDSEYAWIGVANTRGQVVVATNPLLEGKAFPKNEALRFIDVTAPIKNEHGQRVGVISAHLSVNWAKRVGQSLVSYLDRENSYEIVIFNNAGLVITSTNAIGYDAPSLFEQVKAVTQSGSPEYLTPELNEDDPHLFGAVKMRGNELGWYIAIGVPSSVAFAKAKALQLDILLIGASIGLLFAALGFLAGNQIQKDLVTAKTAAEAATRSKSRFLAQMSHEIRTPINGVLGMTQLLLDTELNREQREYASTVKFSGESLLAIINDILDISKVEAGKLELEMIPFDLTRLVGETLLALSPLYEPKRLSVHFIEPAVKPVGYPFYEGDPGRIRQIIMNLVGNAIKFTKEGSVTVKISTDPTDLEGLLFEIIDTGIGLSPESVERLFKSFQQADATTTRKFGGTGLGLSISKNLVSLMGGEIGVDSELGKGSNFWFCFSLPTVSEALVATADAQDGLKSTTGARILIVEDNIVNLKIAQKLLQKVGYETSEALNGVEALDLLSKNNYDLVLMDCQMPEMDGFEATRKIRAHQSSQVPHSRIDARIPIIAMTASAMPEEREACLNAGMNEHVSKPFQLAHLVMLIEKWLAVSTERSVEETTDEKVA